MSEFRDKKPWVSRKKGRRYCQLPNEKIAATQSEFWKHDAMYKSWDHMKLRARAKINSHFGIPSSGHFWQILKSKNLEIVHYYSAFYSLKSTKPNPNLSAKNDNLFFCEP